MQKHHTVQEAYLKQWIKSPTENYFCIYVIPENTYIEKGGPGWSGFFKNDFNILKGEGSFYYLPEKFATRIDTLGINVIRKIDTIHKEQLSGEDRSALSAYIVLQYIRTPRYREELDKLLEKQFQYSIKKDPSSPNKISTAKEEILKHKPINKQEELALEWVRKVSNKEIESLVSQSMCGENLHLRLTKTGHSKYILKLVNQLAKELFEFRWSFLIAGKETSFITSDNPCFNISKRKIGNGLLSPSSITIFPIRPDLCICMEHIKPIMYSKTEGYVRLDKQKVKSINRMIIANSYQAVVARDAKHLKSITKNFDYKNHRKTRDIVIREKGDYTMFNIE